ncbi:MAG: hypothetical protein A2860_01890 [Candidatus Levybacteria bacterium RIFCSPHIGHO2_01_FULL_37_33]|nr:MAG: hypothetical protein A2860_01890 [Candidatus Levybacteria bacterium RIFCSPHIGHO2_01_FULL_37_33]OGH29427.1 MAG: hypothetical protein A3F30_02910 [Candidatus Levybacteria bacterium RIFCSPHIGHO2_12_FULL_37_12]
MILFGRPLVWYVGSNFLEVFETNSNNQQKLSFSPASIQHSEIVDEKKYSEELQKFIEGLPLKRGKGIIVLSAELVYANDIDITGKNEKDEAEKFLTSVPLLRSSIATITLRNKNKLRIIAANRKLYEGIVEALKMNNIEIFSVVPVSVFPNRTNNQEFTVQEAKKTTGEKRILQRYNFLQTKDNPQADKGVADTRENLEVEEVGKKSMRKQYVLLAISVILLACAIGYFLLWSKTIPNPWFKKSESLSPKPTSVATPSTTSQPSPTAEPLMDKSTIKIKILNGSGIEGQAGKLSDLLEEAGYNNVSIGNTDNLEQRTTIVYNKLLSKDMLDSITEAIKNGFPDPTLQEASQSAEYDILITTGKF